VTGDRKVKKLSTQRLWAGVSHFIKPASLMILAMASTLAIHEASAHGYVSSPKSRVIQCKEDNIETPQSPACQAAKAAGTGGLYTPQEVAVGGVKDNHMSFIPDGRLCSANRANLYGMDLARNDWLATQVSPGVRQFVWTNTAAHKTKYFRYYITPEGYNHTQPLRWSDLTLIHDSGPAGQEWISTHNVNLPNRTGRHIIYSIWQRDWDTDAAEGFYQCIDVVFSGSTSSTGTVSSSSSRPASSSSAGTSSVSSDTCASLGTWNAGTIYQPPTSVKHNGKRYQAAYWTQGADPATNSAGQGSPWIDLGTCSGTITSSVAGTSSSRSSVAVSSSSSVNNGNCSSPNYVDGSSYATGALVKNGGSEYRCLVGGWCTVGGPYAPGSGWAWTNAWSYVRSCQ
jgi:chitin-binding protein